MAPGLQERQVAAISFALPSRFIGALTVRPGVIEMLKVARDSTDYEPWTFATLLLTPAPELDDRTPIAWMRDPDQDQGELRTLAQRWVHEWSQ